jgi:hypothetical protein
MMNSRVIRNYISLGVVAHYQILTQDKPTLYRLTLMNESLIDDIEHMCL